MKPHDVVSPPQRSTFTADFSDRVFLYWLMYPVLRFDLTALQTKTRPLAERQTTCSSGPEERQRDSAFMNQHGRGEFITRDCVKSTWSASPTCNN